MSLLLNGQPHYPQNMIHRDLSVPTNYEVNESFKEYKERLAEVVEQNLKLLNEVPLNIDFKKELIEYFKADIPKELDNDPLFEKSLEINRYAKDMSNKIRQYFKEIFKFNDNFKKSLNGDSLHVSKMFINSDLPISFLNTLNDSYQIEMDYIDIYNMEIKKERLGLIVNLANRIKFERLCKNHNAWVSAFDEKQDEMEQSRFKLIWYVDFNNSKSVDEVFKDKKLKKSSLDTSILNKFITNLREKVTAMEQLNSSLMDCSDLFLSEIDEGTKAILNMTEILSKH